MTLAEAVAAAGLATWISLGIAIFFYLLLVPRGPKGPTNGKSAW